MSSQFSTKKVWLKRGRKFAAIRGDRPPPAGKVRTEFARISRSPTPPKERGMRGPGGRTAAAGGSVRLLLLMQVHAATRLANLNWMSADLQNHALIAEFSERYGDHDLEISAAEFDSMFFLTPS